MIELCKAEAQKYFNNEHVTNPNTVKNLVYLGGMYNACDFDYIHRMTKKSWFANMMGMEREEYRHTITIRNKQLNQVKADIVHAFLSVSELLHLPSSCSFITLLAISKKEK